MGTFYPECPYCYKEFEEELDQPDSNKDFETECPCCGKKFKFYLEYSVDIYSKRLEEDEEELKQQLKEIK